MTWCQNLEVHSAHTAASHLPLNSATTDQLSHTREGQTDKQTLELSPVLPIMMYLNNNVGMVSL